MKFGLTFSGVVMIVAILAVGFWLGKNKPGTPILGSVL